MQMRTPLSAWAAAVWSSENIPASQSPITFLGEVVRIRLVGSGIRILNTFFSWSSGGYSIKESPPGGEVKSVLKISPPGGEIYWIAYRRVKKQIRNHKIVVFPPVRREDSELNCTEIERSILHTTWRTKGREESNLQNTCGHHIWMVPQDTDFRS